MEELYSIGKLSKIVGLSIGRFRTGNGVERVRLFASRDKRIAQRGRYYRYSSTALRTV